MEAKQLNFPSNFLWGTGISAHQVEGNNHNQWTVWEKSAKRIEELKNQGKNPSEYISGQACDHYHLYKQDFDLAQKLNNNALRFSLEWSRIEPEPGKFNQKEIEHYKKVLLALRERNLEPFVTLWHWTNPIWFEKMGGWLNKKSPEYYTHYVEKVIQELGHLAKFWLTINEPLMYSSLSYFEGLFPPQKRNSPLVIKVIRNLIQAHQKAYQIIHQKKDKQVGLAKSIFYFEAFQNRLINRLLKKIADYFWNEYFLNQVKNHLDFIGLNYYTCSRIKFNWLSLRSTFISYTLQEISDRGWEIYPSGIYDVLQDLKKYRKPIYITENGLADAQDKKRAKFIIDHLKMVHRAIQAGVDVRGYFHWSLIDNFEWEVGFWPRFGLAEVNYQTMKRIPRPSAQVYAKICQENKLIL